MAHSCPLEPFVPTRLLIPSRSDFAALWPRVAASIRAAHYGPFPVRYSCSDGVLAAIAFSPSSFRASLTALFKPPCVRAS
jgi:hypothetical protein